MRVLLFGCLSLLLVACGARSGLLDAHGSSPGGQGTGGTAGSNTGGFPGTGGAGGAGGSGGIITGATEIALGSYHTCASRYDSSVLCWGGNRQGQLGDNTDVPRATPTRVPLPTAGILDLVAGFRHTCIALATGDVFCWGENLDGQVGLPDLGSQVRVPMRVSLPNIGNSGVVDLAAGEYHTCAVLSDGRLFCWGSDRQGQLGVGDGTMKVPPTEVPLPGSAQQAVAGDFFTCVLFRDSESRVACFGQNAYGQLGDGTLTDSALPVLAQVEPPIQRIDAGGFFTLARPDVFTPDGLSPLLGWGENSSGQLGPEAAEKQTSPVPVTPAWNFADWSAGLSHACAVRWFGDRPWETRCWGSNGTGQLGDGTTTPRDEPALVAADFEAIRVEAGLLHTCAFTLNGEVYCWGENQFGQLGDGTTERSLVPVRVQGM